MVVVDHLVFVCSLFPSYLSFPPIQYFPILYNLKHPQFLFIEDGREIIQKYLTFNYGATFWVEIDEKQGFKEESPLKNTE